MGPTGMPAIDCRNGYRGYNNSLNNTEDTMGVISTVLLHNIVQYFAFLGSLRS